MVPAEIDNHYFRFDAEYSQSSNKSNSNSVKIIVDETTQD